MTNKAKELAEEWRLAKAYAARKYGSNEGLDPFEDELSNIVKDSCMENFLAGFRAAVAEAEKMAMPYKTNDAGEAVGPEKFWVKLSDLKKLLEEG